VSTNIVIHDDNSFEVNGQAFDIQGTDITIMVVTGETTDPSRWSILNQQSVPVDNNKYFSTVTPPFSSGQVEKNKVSLVILNDNIPITFEYNFPINEKERVFIQNDYDPSKLNAEIESQSELPAKTELANEFSLPKPEWMTNSSYNLESGYEAFSTNKNLTYFQARDYKNGKVNTFLLQAFDNVTGKLKWTYNFRKQNEKWLTLTKMEFSYGKTGDIYFILSNDNGEHWSIYSINSKGKENWIKKNRDIGELFPLSDGNLAVVESKGDKSDTKIIVFNPNGKQLSVKQLKSRFVKILDGGYVVSYYPSELNKIEIYKNVSSLNKPILSYNIPQKYSGVDVHQLSGGSIILELTASKNKGSHHDLQAFSAEGKLKWTRSLPQGSTNMLNPFFVVGNNFLLKDKEHKKLSLYDTNNKLISSKEFELTDDTYVVINPSKDITIESSRYVNSKLEDSYYVLDGKNLKMKHSIKLMSNEYKQNALYFVEDNTLYRVTNEKTLFKYKLK
jgi:hypothetical protein